MRKSTIQKINIAEDQAIFYSAQNDNIENIISFRKNELIKEIRSSQRIIKKLIENLNIK